MAAASWRSGYTPAPIYEGYGWSAAHPRRGEARIEYSGAYTPLATERSFAYRAREVIFSDAQNIIETVDCFYEVNRNYPSCVGITSEKLIF